MKKANLAIIPARRGSKRIKNKNIKKFYGVPIISYAIKTALETKMFDKVVVSTDCLKIAKLSKKLGADVPFLRSKSLSDDMTNVDEVIKHAILWFEEHSFFYKNICCIYPTNPFLNVQVIKNVYKLLIKNKSDYAFTVSKFTHNIQRGFNLSKNNKIKKKFTKYEKKRSQDLKEYYHDAGQIYWGKRLAFKNMQNLFTAKSSAYCIPGYLTHDINTMEDWRRAELFFKILRKKKQ